MSRLPMPARPRPRLLAALLVGLLGLLLLPPVARAATSVEVRIGAGLSPATVTVAPGTTVTWVNEDDQRHRMRSTAGPEEFDSGNLEPGDRFSHTFAAAGTTSYVDDRNEEDTAYHGSVTVSTTSEPEPTDPTEPTGPTTHQVSMRNRVFTPTRLEITTGDTVRFLNDDDRDHTATADDGSFDSGLLAPGQDFSRRFTTAGTFSYLCLLHPDMVGTIAVADPGGTAPPPAPAPQPDPTTAPPPASADPAPSPGGGGAVTPQRRTVEMRDFSFAPATIEVPAGSTVVFENTGRALHTATADDGSFDSDLVSPGGSYERRFDQPGTFSYLCLLHPEMVGEVRVTATAGGGGVTAAPPPASPSSSATAGGTAGGTTTSPPPRAPGTVLVSLQDFVFAPADIRVQVGDTVRFRNDGAALHTATARDGSHDSGLLRPGAVDERTFDTAGTFAYWCTLHPDMVATVRVADAAGAVPAPDPTSEDPPSAAAAGADRDTATGEDGAGAAVSMVDDEFLPRVLEVAVGSEVVWTNDGAAVHTVTADDGAFDSGLVAPGAQFTMTFDEPGTVAYSCIVHPGMTGEVRVLALGEDGTATGGGSASADGLAGGEEAGMSTTALQLLLLVVFAIALAAFTALAGRIGAADPEHVG